MANNLDIDFRKFKIESKFMRDGKKCIFDPIREILVIETPEELVRQKFIRYLNETLKVPKSMIEIEVPMSHFKKGKKGRADIVVHAEDDSGTKVPIIVIECKAKNVVMIDDVWDQVLRYDEILDTGFIIITNESVTYAAKWDEDDYYFLTELPTYSEIIDCEEFEFEESENFLWKRPPFKALLRPHTIEQFTDYGWIGEDTSKELYPLITNLS